MNVTNYEVAHCGAFSIPHSHPTWVKMLKALLLSSILATWPAYLNLLDLITSILLNIMFHALVGRFQLE